MTDDLTHYSLLAGIFQYPEEWLDDRLERTESLIGVRYPDAVIDFEAFREGIMALNQREREEYFVKTFEVEAVCCMDIGYVLFGEDYKRGDFLAKIQHEQNLARNDLGSELADHLPNLLTLLPKMKDRELASELGFSLILPALTELEKQVESAGNFYRFAFRLLQRVMEDDFRDLPYHRFVIQDRSNLPVEPGYACGSDFLETSAKRQL